MTFSSFGDTRIDGLDSTQSSGNFWFDLHFVHVETQIKVCRSDKRTFSHFILHSSAKLYLFFLSCIMLHHVWACAAVAHSLMVQKIKNHHQTYFNVASVNPGDTRAVFTESLHARSQVVSVLRSLNPFRETTLSGGQDHLWPHTLVAGIQKLWD